MSRKAYTEKQKATKLAKAEELRKAGKSWDEIAKAVGLARLTLFNWMHPKAKLSVPDSFSYATKNFISAVLETPEAQKLMLLKIKGWVERELAKF